MRGERRAKILVAGVAGFNRGDDAIAHALVAKLRERFERYTPTVTVLKAGVFTRDRAREVVVSRKNPLSHARLAHAVWESSLVMAGGGSIIQDEFHASALRGIMALYLELALLARRFGRPLVTAPIGVDTLHSEQGRRIARRILGQCALVAVRDQRSADNARALLGADVRIVLGADPAFCLGGVAQPLVSPPRLVVSPAFEANTSDALPELLAQLIQQFLARHPDGDCRIVAMDERPEEDGGRSQAILDALEPRFRSAVAVSVPHGVDEVVALLHGATALLTMRLHPMILAAGVTPALCLSRGVKTDSIARELSVPVISLRSEAWTSIGPRFAAFLEEIGESRGLHLEGPRQAVLGQRARMEAYLEALSEVFPGRAAFRRSS